MLRGAGGPISGLQVNELALFSEGKLRVTQLESVCDTCNDVTLGSDTHEDPNLATLTNFFGIPSHALRVGTRTIRPTR